MRLRPFLLLVLTLLASLGTAQLTKNAIREKPFVPPKRWAIVIGAQEYAEYGRLKYAAKDAKDFAKLLVDDLDFQPDTVRLITDAPESTLKPTAETIQTELKAKLADGRLDKGDLFIFFFAGHGVGTPNGDYLLPANATKDNVEKAGVRAKDIVAAFVEAGLKNVLVIADACRSGEKNTFGSELYELGEKANIGVMLGCAPGARSYEYPGLGHGAFTNFLLKAIRDKENVSRVSGALWVSKLAQDVKNKVRVYTERDYPSNPQEPTMETRETHDILLGAYPSLATLTEASKAMLEESKKLTPDAFRSAILNYAQIFYVNDLNTDSIELLRAGDAVFQLSPEDRYILAMNLEQLGRTEESQREFSKIQKQTENELYRYLATLLNPGRKIDPKQRVEAAQKAWKLEPTEFVAKIAWAALRISASSADENAFLKQILDSPLISGRARTFLESEQLSSAGDWKGAYKKLEACLAMEGDYPDDYALDASLFTAKIKLSKTDDLEAFLNDAILRSPKKKGKWLLLLADLQDELGNKDAALATVQRALKTPLEPEDLLHCIRLASLRYLQLKVDILIQVKRYPLAWRARLAEFWLTKLGQADAQSQMETLTKDATFCDDPFSLMFECYRILDIQLEDALKLKAVSTDQYLQLMLAYSSDMILNVDKFGYDVFPWMLLVKFSLMCERYEQLKLLFDYKLGPMLDDGTIDPLLRAPYL
ncbi:MAG: caspase family protein, partial [Fimbriimonadaceae bacterium]|nr:caspase family protein [Fimbriimonadaceae bacterium]